MVPAFRPLDFFTEFLHSPLERKGSLPPACSRESRKRADTVGEPRIARDHAPQRASIGDGARVNSAKQRDYEASKWGRRGFANSIGGFSGLTEYPFPDE